MMHVMLETKLGTSSVRRAMLVARAPQRILLTTLTSMKRDNSTTMTLVVLRCRDPNPDLTGSPSVHQHQKKPKQRLHQREAGRRRRM